MIKFKDKILRKLLHKLKKYSIFFKRCKKMTKKDKSVQELNRRKNTVQLTVAFVFDFRYRVKRY